MKSSQGTGSVPDEPRLDATSSVILEIFLDAADRPGNDWLDALALSEEAGRRHGPRWASRLLPGDSYPRLRELVDAAWLEDQWDARPPGGPDGAVCRYRLTGEGARAARRSLARRAAARRRSPWALRPGTTTA